MVHLFIYLRVPVIKLSLGTFVYLYRVQYAMYDDVMCVFFKSILNHSSKCDKPFLSTTSASIVVHSNTACAIFASQAACVVYLGKCI